MKNMANRAHQIESMRKANFQLSANENQAKGVGSSCYTAFISNVADAEGFAQGRAHMMTGLRGSNVQIGQKDWKNSYVPETKEQFKAPNDYAAL